MTRPTVLVFGLCIVWVVAIGIAELMIERRERALRDRNLTRFSRTGIERLEALANGEDVDA